MTQEDVFMRDQADSAGEEPSTAQTEKYLLFHVGRICSSAYRRSRWWRSSPATPSPNCPWFPATSSGIINLRGQIIPIVDIRRLLGGEACQSNCMMILQSEDTQVGILVDQVQKMVDLDVSTLLPVPPQPLQRAGVRHVLSGGRADHAGL